MKVTRFSDAADFLKRTEEWLLRREAEHNLILGLTGRLAETPDPRYETPLYFAAIEDGGEIVGCAFRTPPFKLGLTRMPPAAVSVLVADLALVYPSIPAIMGSADEAVAAGDQWVALKGGTAVPGRRHRIHEARDIIMPPKPAPGHLRRAGLEDEHMAVAWSNGFYSDTNQEDVPPGNTARRLIAERSLYLWDDGVPRCMVAAMGPTRNGIRIAYVYTPPDYRGQGFASVAVGTLSRQLLDGGREFCFLYTDVANPTSNAIYARLGYRAVAEVIDVDLTPGISSQEP